MKNIGIFVDVQNIYYTTRDIYNKQFVAFTYTVERDTSTPGQNNINCWNESVYVTLGNC